jgi:hypothetical protein
MTPTGAPGDSLMHPESDAGDDYAVCLECGAEDVWFIPHNEGCTEAGDIIVKAAPGWDGKEQQPRQEIPR